MIPAVCLFWMTLLNQDLFPSLVRNIPLWIIMLLNNINVENFISYIELEPTFRDSSSRHRV